MGVRKTRKILFSILAVLIMLTASLAAIFTIQPKKVDAAITEDNNNPYRIVIYNSAGHALSSQTFEYGEQNDSVGTDFGRPYWYSTGARDEDGNITNDYGYLGSGHAYVTTLTESVYEGDTITIQFGYFNGTPNRPYFMTFNYNSSTSSARIYGAFEPTGNKTTFSIPYNVTEQMTIVTTDNSTAHAANSSIGYNMLYICNINIQKRATTGGWGSGTLLDAVNSVASGGTYTYNGSAYSPFQPLIDAGYVTVVSGTASATNVDEYSVTLKPAMEYKWSDKDGYGEKTFTWSISKADWGLSLDSSAVSLDTQSPNGSFGGKLSGNDKSGVTYESSDSNVIQITNPSTGEYTVVGVGKATITVKKGGDNNHKAFEGTFEVNVTKAAGFYIGDTYYADLQSAVEAANGATTITVVGSPTVDSTVTIPSGKNITLTGENGASINRGKGHLGNLISVEGGTLTIENLRVDGHQEHKPEASIISVSDGTLNANVGAILTNNGIGSFGNGGAINATGGIVNINGAQFGVSSKDRNSAKNGGNIAVSGTASLNITSGKFYYGGAFMGNGGSIYVAENAKVTIGNETASSEILFEGNYTGFGAGGAIYVDGGSLTINDGEFKQNNANFYGAGNGGALYVAGGEVTVNGGSFENNLTNGGAGAGVFVGDGQKVTINGENEFKDNFGIAGNGQIVVDGTLSHRVNVEFADPANQINNVGTDNNPFEYVVSANNTSQELKDDFRVVNPGYTFNPVDGKEGTNGALKLVPSSTIRRPSILSRRTTRQAIWVRSKMRSFLMKRSIFLPTSRSAPSNAM